MHRRHHLLASFLFFCIAAQVEAGTTSANSSIKAEIGGSIPHQLPRPKTKELSNRHYPSLGDIRITTDQFCGDSDVAHYASTHPEVRFVTNGTVQFVLGYWLGVAGANRPLPTAQNWFPLGSTSLASDDASTTSMQPMGGGSQTSIMTLTRNAMRGLTRNTGFRMPAQAGSLRKDAHFGIMMCDAVLGNAGSNMPVAYEVMQSFSEGVPNAVAAELEQGGPLSSMQKFALNVDSAGVSIDVVQSGNHSVQNDPLFSLAKDLQNLQFPQNVDDIDAYREAIADRLDNNNGPGPALSQLAQDFVTKPSCAQVYGVINNAANYWWEPFPMQLACAQLNGIAALLSQLRDPASLPSQADFIETRQKIIERLVKAAFVQNAERAFNTQYASAQQTTRCFNPDRQYVDSVMGSLLIDVGGSAASNTLNMIHPEPYFAIGGDAPYRNATGNQYTIYAASSSARPTTIERGIVAAAPALQNRSFLLNYRVRGVGCGQNWYCQLPGVKQRL